MSTEIVVIDAIPMALLRKPCGVCNKFAGIMAAETESGIKLVCPICLAIETAKQHRQKSMEVGDGVG